MDRRQSQMALGAYESGPNEHWIKNLEDWITRAFQEYQAQGPEPTASKKEYPDNVEKILGNYPRAIMKRVNDLAIARAKTSKPIPEIMRPFRLDLVPPRPSDDGRPVPFGQRGPRTRKRWIGDLIHPWNMAKKFDGGMEMTNVKVFVRTDASDTIVDRIVEKNTRYKIKKLWESPTTWLGQTPVTTKDPDLLVPLEWFLQSIASSRPDAKYIVGVRSNASISTKDRFVRMYVEYAPYGDLDHVMEWYNGQEGEEERLIPYPFLIYVFKALVQACLVLKQGSTTLGLKDWEEIVHRDMKPANVFLDEPLTDYFPSYPTPKLADFGHARALTEEDLLNSALHNRGDGTQGFRPPEQLQFIDENTGKPVHDFKLLSPANVWGIGATILTLVVGAYTEDPFDTYCRMDIDGLPTWTITDAEMRKQYGDWLLDLVEECLLINPDERPTLEELDRRLSEVNEREATLKGLSTGRIDPKNTNFDVRSLKGQEYKMGMLF